jgi:hypothetical protein
MDEYQHGASTAASATHNFEELTIDEGRKKMESPRSIYLGIRIRRASRLFGNPAIQCDISAIAKNDGTKDCHVSSSHMS